MKRSPSITAPVPLSLRRMPSCNSMRSVLCSMPANIAMLSQWWICIISICDNVSRKFRPAQLAFPSSHPSGSTNGDASEYPFWLSKTLCLSFRNTHFESQNTHFESQKYCVWVSEIHILSLRIPILNLKNTVFKFQKYTFWIPILSLINTCLESQKYLVWASEILVLSLRNTHFESQNYPFWVSEHPSFSLRIPSLSFRILSLRCVVWDFFTLEES